MNSKLIAGLVVAGTGAILLGRWATSSTAGATSIDGADHESDELPRAVVASCQSEANGTLCGTPDTSKFCMSESCVTNTCGDRRVLGDEQCDDGNLSSGDGCVACRWEALAKCGNGRIDRGEECDDGNLTTGDACSARCTSARCGDGVKNAGEECDDGNHDDIDDCASSCRKPPPGQGRVASLDERGWARSPDGSWVLTTGTAQGLRARAASRSGYKPGSGSGPGAGGSPTNSNGKGSSTGSSGQGAALTKQSAGATTVGGNPGGTKTDACKQCREERCRNYGGLDVIAGCYQAVNPEVAPAGDTTYLDDCQDIVSCGRAHGCFWDPAREMAGCYCGSISVDECVEKGPAKDAPCVEEWQRGTRSVDNAVVLKRFSLVDFPAGMAFLVLQCDLRECKDHCFGNQDQEP